MKPYNQLDREGQLKGWVDTMARMLSKVNPKKPFSIGTDTTLNIGDFLRFMQYGKDDDMKKFYDEKLRALDMKLSEVAFQILFTFKEYKEGK